MERVISAREVSGILGDDDRELIWKDVTADDSLPKQCVSIALTTLLKRSPTAKIAFDYVTVRNITVIRNDCAEICQL